MSALDQLTPWQRVYSKFGLNQSGLAKLLGCHRSKICRALKDERGLISGEDQELILSVAPRAGAVIKPSDLVSMR